MSPQPRLTEEEISVENAEHQETEENENISDQPGEEETSSALPGGVDRETGPQEDRTDCSPLEAGSDQQEENSSGPRRWCCNIL